ncbi:MAG: phosphatidylserine decarboxylase, partial [Oscillospiraceae bacterium]|nr:phosphatidylserine decarboxylase [Oscillospiraceae bacterium]
VLREKYIDGRLHTVSPISAKRYKVFAENCRSVSFLETENFGECYQVEIGALLVGKIINRKVKVFERGDEKGYFEMGGSTCVVMLKKDAAIIDEDIRENSDKGIETKVLMGERIGRKNA